MESSAALMCLAFDSMIARLSSYSPLSLLSAAWLRHYEWVTGPSVGLSDRAVFVLYTFAVHELVYLSLALLVLALHASGALDRYLLQPMTPLDWKQARACLWELLTRAGLGQLPVLWMLYPAFASMGMTIGGPLPSAGVIVRDVLLSFLFTDTSFYWAHRALHHPLLYKRFHKKHHEWKKSAGINTEYAHPLEHMSNVLTTIGGSFLLGSHILVMWAYLAFRLVETVDAHSGFELPASPFTNEWMCGSRMHDFHHSKNVGCYGTYTIFWDWLCGTDKAFLEHQRKREQKLRQFEEDECEAQELQ
jgi:methylsterol monooxygenase